MGNSLKGNPCPFWKVNWALLKCKIAWLESICLTDKNRRKIAASLRPWTDGITCYSKFTI